MWSFQLAFFHSSQGYLVLKQKPQKLRFIFRKSPSDVIDLDANCSDLYWLYFLQSSKHVL